MRRGWMFVSALVAPLATACMGGQTGEITELTACHAPIGVAAVDAPSEAGPSARDQLEALTTSLETELSWEGEAPSTRLTISFALSGEPGTLLGGIDCERPWLEAPVTLRLQTADGALDETIEGAALLADGGAASVEGSIALTDMSGALELAGAHPDLDSERATLRVDLQAERGALRGQLLLDPGTEDAGYSLLATF